MRRPALTLVAAALLLAACSKPDRQSPFVWVKIPEGRPASPAAAAEQIPEAGDVRGGELLLYLVDQNGNHPEGIPVDIVGPVSAMLVSSGEGTVHLRGPAGFYDFTVPAVCTERLDIVGGATGRGGIAPGQLGTGELRVSWRQRFAPAGMVRFSPDEGRAWLKDRPITVSFDVVDRCEEIRAPGASFASFDFRPSANLRVISRSIAAGSDGRGSVVVACTGKEGYAQLMVADARNPADRFEMFRRQSGPIPYCEP